MKYNPHQVRTQVLLDGKESKRNSRLHFGERRLQEWIDDLPDIAPDRLEEFCPMDAEASRLMRSAFEKMNLSARGYHRIIRVARTIADLEGSETIQPQHVMEAIQYRSLDRKYWKG